MVLAVHKANNAFAALSQVMTGLPLLGTPFQAMTVVLSAQNKGVKIRTPRNCRLGSRLALDLTIDAQFHVVLSQHVEIFGY